MRSAPSQQWKPCVVCGEEFCTPPISCVSSCSMPVGQYAPLDGGVAPSGTQMAPHAVVWLFVFSLPGRSSPQICALPNRPVVSVSAQIRYLRGPPGAALTAALTAPESALRLLMYVERGPGSATVWMSR